MVFPSVISVGVIRPLVVCLLAGSLGGCYTLGGGGKAPVTPPAPSVPALTPFSTFVGSAVSKGVVTRALQESSSISSLTVETSEQPTHVEATVRAPDSTTKQQQINFSAGFGSLGSGGIFERRLGKSEQLG